jgi:RHH-type rel operon transcriptional repressor/antitoxin RelB
MRDDVLERIEDAEDLAALREALAQDDGTRYFHEQLLKELGMQ